MNGSSAATVAFTSAPATIVAAAAASLRAVGRGASISATATIIASIITRSLWAPPRP